MFVPLFARFESAGDYDLNKSYMFLKFNWNWI